MFLIKVIGQQKLDDQHKVSCSLPIFPLIKITLLHDFGFSFLALLFLTSRRGSLINRSSGVIKVEPCTLEMFHLTTSYISPKRDFTILKLIAVYQSIADLGETVLFIEHNRTLIEAADRVITLGPEVVRGVGRC